MNRGLFAQNQIPQMLPVLVIGHDLALVRQVKSLLDINFLAFTVRVGRSIASSVPTKPTPSPES